MPAPGYDYIPVYNGHLETRSKHRRAPSLWPYRQIRSLLKTYHASRKPINIDETTSTTTDNLHRVGAGEIERHIGAYYDWTRDWNYQLSVEIECHPRCLLGHEPPPDHIWQGRCRIYFNDVSVGLGGDAIPWNDPVRMPRFEDQPWNRTRTSEGVSFTWMFCDGLDRPQWGGRFILHYKAHDVFATSTTWALMGSVERPWAFFNPVYSTSAEVESRTGPGGFKKVMWYRPRAGYGNDVLNQPVEPWKNGHKAQYAEFARHFLPHEPARN